MRAGFLISTHRASGENAAIAMICRAIPIPGQISFLPVCLKNNRLVKL
jgi:hypothetical protein